MKRLVKMYDSLEGKEIQCDLKCFEVNRLSYWDCG